MMKAKYIFGALALSTMIVSCSENAMDKVNKDNDHPAVGVVNGKFQITDAEVASVYNIACGNYAWNVASYTEQLPGTGNNQLEQVEMRDPIQTAASATFNNEWNVTYANLLNLKQIIAKCGTGGVNVGDNDLLAMAQTLDAYNWGILTDLHGDVPCSEALTTNPAPKIDAQKDVYTHIINLLDSAIINSTTAITNKQKTVNTQDLLFGNDMHQWRGLAHALKARYKLHLYGRDNSVLPTVISEANAAIADGFNGANLTTFTGQGQDNAWSAYWFSRYYTASGTTVDNLMLSRNDPREPIYNWDTFGNNVIMTPGNKSQAQQTQYMNAPAWIDNGAAYSHLFSISELYFILAEAQVRSGQDATNAFNTAVGFSIDDYNATGAGYNDNSNTSNQLGNTTPDVITPAAKATFIAGLTTNFTANPLSEILVQKYIAQARDEQIETYNDIRRCRYIDGSYPVAMTNPNNTNSVGNRWPLCLPYGQSDVVSNPNVTKAFGTGNNAGMYVFTNNVWFAGGN